MIASVNEKTQVLLERGAREKLRGLEACLHSLLKGERAEVPFEPGRDVQILPVRQLPLKKGLALNEAKRVREDLSLDVAMLKEVDRPGQELELVTA